jgi:AAHS family 4-hydroxybenzoate transporter-like MFS transporter
LALLVALPESVRFLVSQGRRPELVAHLLRRLAPDRRLPKDAAFALGDEGSAPTLSALFADRPRWRAPLLRLRHVLGVLFAGSLRWITPLLWLAYICSSMAVFFFATWSPLVFEALGYSRSDAASAASVNALAGALGGLLLMRFTDARGAIAVALMPLVAAPMLLVAGFVDLGYWGFLGAVALISLFLIGGHFGLHSIAGIFYPSAYRSNGAGWAVSVAKIGAIAGPWIAGDLLSAGLPVRHIYAVVAVCPAVFVLAIAIVGLIHMRLLRREQGEAAATADPRLAPASSG